MKRVYLLILALVAWMAVPAQAQFKWGIKGGANISSIHFTNLPENFSTENLTGFHIGPTIELMAPLVGLGFDASILYSQTGMEIGTQTVKSEYTGQFEMEDWYSGCEGVCCGGSVCRFPSGRWQVLGRSERSD